MHQAQNHCPQQEVQDTRHLGTYGRLTTSGWSMEYSLLMLKYMRTNHGFWHPPSADFSQQALTNTDFAVHAPLRGASSSLMFSREMMT